MVKDYMELSSNIPECLAENSFKVLWQTVQQKNKIGIIQELPAWVALWFAVLSDTIASHKHVESKFETPKNSLTGFLQQILWVSG